MPAPAPDAADSYVLYVSSRRQRVCVRVCDCVCVYIVGCRAAAAQLSCDRSHVSFVIDRYEQNGVYRGSLLEVETETDLSTASFISWIFWNISPCVYRGSLLEVETETDLSTASFISWIFWNISPCFNLYVTTHPYDKLQCH